MKWELLSSFHKETKAAENIFKWQKTLMKTTRLSLLPKDKQEKKTSQSQFFYKKINLKHLK